MEDKFDRIEKKYLITKDEKKALLKLIKHNMKRDAYHKSEVMNLYFDNDNYDLTQQSIDWVDFKEKLRARSYLGYDRVFMEIKTKVRAPRRAEDYRDDEWVEDNIGYKRRVMITNDDFGKLMRGEASLVELAKQSVEEANDLQVAREFEYLMRHFELKPKIMVTYERESYKDEAGFRITFDEKLKYRETNLSFVKGRRDKIYLKDGRNVIMEIKARGALPLWLVRKMSELHIYPQPFSKIGKIYELIRKDQNV